MLNKENGELSPGEVLASEAFLACISAAQRTCRTLSQARHDNDATCRERARTWNMQAGRLGTFSLLLACVLGCNRADQRSVQPAAGEPAEPLSVYVVNYPLLYFAERIGGDSVNVRLPVPGGLDPAFWRPDAETIARYQRADLILLNGANYAKWTATTSLPASKCVDTSASFHDRYLVAGDQVRHAHGPGGAHTHGSLASTTWLDPRLAIAQADSIRARFSALLPSRAERFRLNYLALESDLAELDRGLSRLVAGNPDQPLFFSHPIYQYLTRRFKLNARDVHWEPDSIPTAEMWREFRETARVHPAKWMIWEAEPVAETVAGLAEHGIRSAVFDPCAQVPAEGDYLQVMQRNVEAMAKVFSTNGKATQ